MSFSDFEYAGKRKQTHRERFLAEMEQLVPWSWGEGVDRAALSEGRWGHEPYPLEAMQRIHLLQNWFSLSDPGMEEVLCEHQHDAPVCATDAQRPDSRRHSYHEFPASSGET